MRSSRRRRPASWRGDPAASTRGRLRAVRARALRARSALERRFPALTALTERLVHVNVLDSAFRLAAQAFLTTMPLLLAFAAFAPRAVRDQLLSSVRTVFGIDDATAAQLRRLLDADGGTLRTTVGILGALMALLSATSLSRALARVLERAWRLPGSSAKVGAWRWLLWIAAWVVILTVQGLLRDGFGAGMWLGAPVSFLIGCVIWSWTQHLLLAARVRWLPLVPGAVLTSLAVTILSLSAHVYMPIALSRSLRQYGPLGAVSTLLSWLVVICVAVCLTLTAGAVLAEEPPLGPRLGFRRLSPESGGAGSRAGREAEDSSSARPSAGPGEGSPR